MSILSPAFCLALGQVAMRSRPDEVFLVLGSRHFALTLVARALTGVARCRVQLPFELPRADRARLLVRLFELGKDLALLRKRLAGKPSQRRYELQTDVPRDQSFDVADAYAAPVTPGAPIGLCSQANSP